MFSTDIVSNLQSSPIVYNSHFTLMTNSAFQTDIFHTTFQGWANYETWNIALWIQNDYSLYCLARECGDYQTFLEALADSGTNSTPDGVSYTDENVNVIELNSEVFDL